MKKNSHLSNGSFRSGDIGTQASLCVILRETQRRLDVSSALRGAGFCVHEFDCGAAFLLSETARTCEGLVAEYQLTGLTLPRLRQALCEAGLELPVVALLRPGEEECVNSADEEPFEVIGFDAPVSVVLLAMKAVLSRRKQ